MKNSDQDAEVTSRKEQVEALFQVILKNVERSRAFLEEKALEVPPTSYVFISGNIRRAIAYTESQMSVVKDKAEYYRTLFVKSPLLLSFPIGPQKSVLFDLRDAARENAEAIRRIVVSIVTDIPAALPAYIVIYETLEKFKVRVPFVLVEEASFYNESISRTMFAHYHHLRSDLRFKEPRIETIAYSGIEMDSPEWLLLLGHEAFHIINKYSKYVIGARTLFEMFCKEAGVGVTGSKARRCEEAFVDALASMYFGPSYCVALMTHFESVGPISDDEHAEMTSRLGLLAETWRMWKYDSPAMENGGLSKSRQRLVLLMSDKQRSDAKDDLVVLGQLLDAGMLGFIKKVFDFTKVGESKVRIYPDFYRFWATQEAPSEIDLMDLQKIRFCLTRNIPVAVRPAILLDLLVNQKIAPSVKTDTVVASIKKWYVKRYYQKAIENAEMSPPANSPNVKTPDS